MTERTRSSRIASGSRAGGGAAPATVEEALKRARQHAQRATAETLAAARALLDALSLALRGEPAETQRAVGRLAQGLDEAFEALSGDPADSLAGPLVEVILDALDVEIARWEGRSRDDTEARAVLRAFIGLREILWEFGLRREKASGHPEESVGVPPVRRSGGRRRVQRIEVEG